MNYFMQTITERMMKIVVFCGIILSCANAQFSGEPTAMSALIKNLFENQSYSPVIRPTFDHTTPTLVIVEMVIVAILSLDTKKQVLTTYGFVRMTWKDELLRWNANDYGGLDNLVIPQTMIWLPDVVFTNIVNDQRYLGGQETRVRVDQNGTVRWEPGFNLVTTCKVDVSKYPFDINVCPIHLFSWMSDNTTVKLELGNTPLRLSPTITNGEYRVYPAHSFKDEFFSISGLIYDEVIFNVKLQRRPEFFVLSLLMPVTLLSIMCSVSFLLEPDEQDKLTVSITVLLSFTVFLGVIDNNLPETSDNISLLVVYVSSMLALGFLGVLGNVIIIKVNRWESAHSLQHNAHANASNGRRLSRSFRRSSRAVHHPDDLKRANSLLSDSDVASDKSDVIKPVEDEENHNTCFDRLHVCANPCKRRFAYVLNKLFLFVNGSLVFCLTIGLWIIMLR